MTDGPEETIEVGDAADEESIFLAARRLLGREQQQLFVEQTCGRDSAKTHRILSLLAVERDDPLFLQKPAAYSRLTALFLRRDLKEGDAIGPYWLLRPLGTGGMGDVWLAEQRSPVYRRVALKLMKNGFGTEADLRLFDSERQILAILDHPGIVKLLDAGETEEGRPWYAMEHVTGHRITDYCIQRQHSLEQRIELFVTMCDAIEHAHQRGVIHCDLKPANILITETQGVPRPKLIDFGVALSPETVNANAAAPSEDFISGQKFRDTAGVQGTLAYMSPEQASGKVAIDRRSDVYSIGAVLYELCVECPPLAGPEWDQATVHDRLRIIREKAPVSLKHRRALRCGKQDVENRPASPSQNKTRGVIRREVLFHDVDHIVRKALEKDPERRYATVQQLTDDLRSGLDSRPLGAGTENLNHRFIKLVLRQRSMIGVLSVLALCILIASIAGRTLALRARNNPEAVIPTETSASGKVDEYVQEIQSAQLYANQGEIEQLQAILPRLELLSRAGSSISDSDRLSGGDRRFELEYLSRFAQLQPTRSQPHRGKVFAVAFTPDGTRLAAGSGDQDHALVIQEASTGEITTRFPEFTNDVNALCFGDGGRLLITAEEAGLIRGWDISGDVAQEVFRLPEFGWPPGTMLLTPGGNHLVVTEIEWRSRQCRMTVWDLPAKKRLATFEGHRALGLCSSGKRLACVTDKNQIQIWILPEFQQEKICAETFTELTCGSMFGEELVAAGNRAGDLWLWNLNSASASLLRVNGAGNHAIRAVEFSVDGDLLFAAYNDGVIRAWDTKSGMMVSCVKSKSGEAWSLNASADGQFLAAGFEGGYVEQHRTEHFTGGFRRRIGNVPLVDGIELSVESEFLIVPQPSGVAINVIRLSDLQSERTIRIEDPGPEEKLQYSIFISATREIVLATTMGRLFVADEHSAIAKLRIDTGLREHLVRPRVSPDGRLCSIAPRDPLHCPDEGLRYCSIRDLTNGEVVARLPDMGVKTAHLPHQFVVFTEAGRFVSVQHQFVALWESQPKTTGILKSPLDKLTRSQVVTHIARLPGSERFLISAADETVHIWEPSKATEKLRLFAYGLQVETTAASPDELTLAIGGANGQIQLRDLQSGQLLLTLQGGNGRILQLNFSQDGTRLFALCETETGSCELLMWGRVYETNDAEP